MESEPGIGAIGGTQKRSAKHRMSQGWILHCFLITISLLVFLIEISWFFWTHPGKHSVERTVAVTSEA